MTTAPAPRLLILLLAAGGAALLLDASVVRAGSADDPDAFVECRVDGRSSYKRRRDCLDRKSVIRQVELSSGSAGEPPWAAFDGDAGVTRMPVVACRTRQALTNVTSSVEENRDLLARVAIEQGLCTRLAQHTGFTITGRSPELMEIQTATEGRLWVSQTARVSGTAGTAAAPRLEPDTGDAPSPTD